MGSTRCRCSTTVRGDEGPPRWPRYAAMASPPTIAPAGVWAPFESYRWWATSRNTPSLPRIHALASPHLIRPGMARRTSPSTASTVDLVVRAWDRASSALDLPASSRSASRSRAFSKATAAVEARASSSSMSSRSNWSSPSFDRLTVPITRSPWVSGTITMLSSRSGVPGMVTANGSASAFGV